jgi:hypothetical protein
MTVLKLKEVMLSENIPISWCVLDGKGVKDFKFCLEHTGDSWNVFYSERGGKYDLSAFDTESEACENLLSRLRKRKQRT